MRVGTDTGGTFTDVVSADGRIVKVLSTRDDPGRAVRAGLAELGLADVEVLAHGTTVATNALLERRGAVVALVTNAGCEDLVEIGRQARPSLYDPFARRAEPLVERSRRHGVVGRLGARGEELVPLDPATIPVLDAAVASVAVCLLHADLSPAHEQAVAAVLRARGHDVTCSHEVSPEYREYERTSTTIANAYLRPSCTRYLAELSDTANEVLVMTSAGGLVPIAAAADEPVRLALSGPAGGVAAAAAIAAACGFDDAVTFDMGGTSADVCLVLGGRPEPASDRAVGGLPLRVPSLDVLTIGAGGGSIAWLDAGGALRVGPRSAGSSPGPVCYGLGGIEPTVTDANLVLGHIDAAATFPGLGQLDRPAAEAAFGRTGIDPAGVLAVVDANMERALRQVSIERGVDPRGLALVAFGGAGPLHACSLADALGMAAVIVPPRAGVLSAAGILTAPEQRDLVRSRPSPLDHATLDAEAAELMGQARRLLAGDRPVSTTVAFDCRYLGQSHEITVPDLAAFPAAHERRNGYARPGHPVEVVAIRARASAPAPLGLADLAPVAASAAVGPRVVALADCTVWIPPGWRAEPTPIGALVLRRDGSGGS